MQDVRGPMLIAGLTGGIATGKSTVAGFFIQAGATVIDADKIAHQALAREGAAYTEVIQAFGPEIVTATGEIDRKVLGEAVFKNPLEKQRLNRIVHPFVFQAIENRLGRLKKASFDGVVILDIPLLIETGCHAKCDEVIVVYIPESLQLRRLIERDRLEEAQAWHRIRSQMPIEEKRRHATLLIDNSGPRQATRRRAQHVYQYLISRTHH